ncbi:uncharacterized protein LOC131286640 [Anopheles ziemanni]|uniref:uncharacterized protein LOC131272238 n=1 Tax=Anopheles coustani TaxID=139045 RepID=UPI00265A5F8F|nr:uncharacterized protein LOC131272238 [Anopheles coustani]XP_058171605.1 uncharacterized protein LOC131286640 [Anopheles ziemanni]
MNVIRFQLPADFEPKCKKYRSRRRIPRSAHTTPDTLFSLSELAIRRMLAGRVPRRKFWATVLSLLPGSESRRSGVRHQVEHPRDFNVHLRSTVNYANHWELLEETLRHEHRWPQVRIGESARNRITRLHQDYPPPQIWQIRPYDMLTSAFIVRTAARIASLEQQRSQGRLGRLSSRTTSNTNTIGGTATTSSTTTSCSCRFRLSRGQSMDVPDDEDDNDADADEVARRYDDLELQQLQEEHMMVIGKRTTGCHQMRLKRIPVRSPCRKKPTR